MLRLRRAPLVAAGVALALIAGAVTPGIVPVAAAWSDREWETGRIATEDVACGTDAGFTTTASARFLRGSLLSVDLDTVAGLSGLSAVDDARPGSQPTPAGVPSPGTGVYVNPLAVTAVAGTAALDLTGLSTGLPGGSAGAVNQYVAVTATGTSTAASGLVSNSGGVGVTAGAAPETLPGRATISLDGVLAPVLDPGGVRAITDTRLAVGAVASRSTLDWCAARRSAVWGDGSVSGVTRDYGIAGLELRSRSAAVGAITTTATTTATTGLTSAATALSNVSTGAVSSAIRSTITSLLSTLGLSALTGTISIGGLDAATTALTPLLTAPLRSSDGTVAVDLATGVVTVDLASLLGGPDGLNSRAPNTEILVDAAVLNAVSSRVGTLVDERNAQIRAALTTALQSVTVEVDVNATVRATVNVLTLGTVTASILDLRVRYDGTVAELVARSKPFTVTTTVLPTSAAVGTAVNALLSTLLGVSSPEALGARLVAALTTGLITPVLDAVTTGLSGPGSPLATLGTDLAALSARAVTATASLVGGLPRALSLRVNVQPDRPNAPPGTVVVPAIPPDTSAAFSVTALRIGLLPASAAAGSTVAVVELATSTAGRNAYRAR